MNFIVKYIKSGSIEFNSNIDKHEKEIARYLERMPSNIEDFKLRSEYIAIGHSVAIMTEIQYGVVKKSNQANLQD